MGTTETREVSCYAICARTKTFNDQTIRPIIPNRNRNITGKKGSATAKSSTSNRGSVVGANNGPSRKSTSSVSSARSTAINGSSRGSGTSRKSVVSGVNSASSNKDDNSSNKDNDEIRDDESPEQDDKEEKKFQPSSHIEAELVDILGEAQTWLSKLGKYIHYSCLAFRTRYSTT